MQNRSHYISTCRYCMAGLLLAIGCSLAQPVSAAGLSSELEATAERNAFRHLDANELESVRGRYVEGSDVLLFGMEMATVWQTPSGETLETRAGLQVDLTDTSPQVNFTPHVTVTTEQAYARQATSNTPRAVIDAGTGNAKGVVQLVQSGGDFNAASNDFQLDIDTGDSSRRASGNGVMESIHASGAAMSIQHGAGGLGTRIVMPGEGEVRQGVRPGKGLHQSIQLTGSRHEVHNLTRMQVRMRQQLDGGMPNGNLRRALESVRGLEKPQ